MQLELLDTTDPRLAPSTDLAVARALLAAAVVVGEDVEDHRSSMAELVGSRPDAAVRSCRPGHLTGSALVVDGSGRTLLMLHRKLGRWFQPGGHADGDTNLAAVALREAVEETGIDGLRVAVPAIDVDVHRVEPPGEDPHLHLDLRFLAVAPPGALERANAESRELRWVRAAELDSLVPAVDASTRRLVHRGLAAATALTS